MVSAPRDAKNLQAIEKLIGKEIPRIENPLKDEAPKQKGMTKKTQNGSIRAERVAKQNATGLQKNITKTVQQRQKSWRLLDWANIFQVLLSSALNSGWIAGKKFRPPRYIPTSSAGIFERMRNGGFDRLVTEKECYSLRNFAKNLSKVVARQFPQLRRKPLVGDDFGDGQRRRRPALRLPILDLRPHSTAA